MKPIGSDPARYLGLVTVMLLIFLWELPARLGWWDTEYLPGISTIGLSLLKLLVSQELIDHLLVSLKRIGAGFFLGSMAGYMVGFVCGYTPRIYAWLELTLELLRPIPSVALIPMAIFVLGIGDALNVGIVAWACSWPTFIHTMDGVRSTDHVLLNTARTLALNRWSVIVKVIFPSSLPHVFTGLRLGLGVAVAVTVISEMAASGKGIGYFILSTSLAHRIADMYAGIVCVGLLGYTLNRLFRILEARAVGWHQKIQSILD